MAMVERLFDREREEAEERRKAEVASITELALDRAVACRAHLARLTPRLGAEVTLHLLHRATELIALIEHYAYTD